MADNDFKWQADNGGLFKNDKRTGNGPNLKGAATIVCPCCKEENVVEVAAWLKEGKKGQWYSLKFQPPYKARSGNEGQERVERSEPVQAEPEDSSFGI